MDKKNKDIYMKMYKNSKGKYHRLDGPALERVDGAKYWYKEGNWHREDGPAVERADGSKIWYKEGKFHRTDGPAFDYFNGNKYWYILDKELKEKDFNSWIFRIKVFI